MKKFLGILTATVFAFGWEINTHRAIDRAAIGMSGNLQEFVKDMYLMQVNHTKQIEEV